MKALVTGGGGFLGGAIVRQLLNRGHEVRSFARGDYPRLRELGVETVRGDLADHEAVAGAVEGVDVVFHAGAKSAVWGTYEEFYLPNVVGTQNVIEACQRHNVKKLIYTSSPSVAFAGEDQEGCDESTPIPEHFLSNYPKTKATAEQLVLQDNGEGVYTVALRPHLIWGPGDTQLIPRILERAKAGKLRFVGDGQNKVDAVYIDNAAHAHLLAAERLGPDAPCGGKVYYITNDDPWPMKKLVNTVLEAAGYPPCEKHISPKMAYAAGAFLETAYRILGKEEEPMMMRFIALQLATHHYYNIEAAKRDLGYAPLITMDEGMERLAESLRSVS